MFCKLTLKRSINELYLECSPETKTGMWFYGIDYQEKHQMSLIFSSILSKWQVLFSMCFLFFNNERKISLVAFITSTSCFRILRRPFKKHIFFDSDKCKETVNKNYCSQHMISIICWFVVYFFTYPHILLLFFILYTYMCKKYVPISLDSISCFQSRHLYKVNIFEMKAIEKALYHKCAAFHGQVCLKKCWVFYFKMF